MSSKNKVIEKSKEEERELIVFRFFLVGVIISFLGWAIETVFCSIQEGKLVDRGFLVLPLCGLYGTAVVVQDLLIGTPYKGRLADYFQKTKLSKPKKITLGIISYLLLSGIIATMVELLVGVFFDKIFSCRLWDYSSLAFNYHGYICLSFSLIWSFLVTFIMSTIYPLCTLLVKRIPFKKLKGLGITLAILIVIDLVFNFIYLTAMGVNFDTIAFLEKIFSNNLLEKNGTNKVPFF
ncbi:MAG: putative ABC transporter permease [Bacilli bacterium]|jgi:uncharacterized membrane protein